MDEPTKTKETLARYKDLIDTDIAEHSQTLTERWEKEFSLETVAILDSYLAILSRGGKRLRGALSIWAYELAGGTDENLAVTLARHIEMIHTYLLVVDDVADLAKVRRGGPSAHEIIKNYHIDQKWFGDPEHFGFVQAINASLALQHLVMQEISELATVDSIKLEALQQLNSVLFTTVIGQISDLNHQAMPGVTEHEVTRMMRQKTAYYSFVSPLQLGVIVAGKDWSEYLWLEKWALDVGLSFQITDDILGMFGDEKLTGKSNLDDLREGKMTLLIVRALERANEQDKTALLKALGNSAIGQPELEAVQAIVENSGALAYSQGLAKQYGASASAQLIEVPQRFVTATTFLAELSDYVLRREK